MLDRPQSVVAPAAYWFLAALTAIVAYLCWSIVAPFVSVLTWAIALAIVVDPLRERLVRRMSDTAAATIVLLIVIAVFTALTFTMSSGLIHKVDRAVKAAAVLQQPSFWQGLIQAHPWIGTIWSRVAPLVDLANILQQAPATIARAAATAVGRSAATLSRAWMSLFVLFFVIRDRNAFVRELRNLLPLTEAETDCVWSHIASAMRASVYGRVVIGIVQGTIGGIVFLAVGIPDAFFWALVMAVLAMLPYVGAFLIWVPAAAILFFTGHWIRALVLAAAGVAIIHPVDNILYPIVIGPRIGLHPVILLIAFLGGLIAFGAAGLILGPAIAACAIGLTEVWSERARA